LIDRGKQNVLGVMVNVVDYETIVEKIISSALHRRTLAVTALAVHGVMTGVMDAEHKYRLNHLDFVVPDGQPVRWALNLLYSAGLSDRVYGPDFTLKICEAAEREGLPVYFYGATPQILCLLQQRLHDRFKNLKIAGTRPSRFRSLLPHEQDSVVDEICSSGAAIVFVGLGCPRQEVWAYEFRNRLPLPVISVGAAFAFHAGLLAQAPGWMQRHGLEWLFRLCCEPRRLWRRYALLNPAFLVLLWLQALGLGFDARGEFPTRDILYG